MASPRETLPIDRSGTLDDHLARRDIEPIDPLGDAAWDRLRVATGRDLARAFCTARNLWVHRGWFTADALGFAWGGLYRALLVGSIVAASHDSGGHLRADERIEGTGEFFRSAFRLPRASARLGELARLVNLRHHVAGIASRDGSGTCRVLDRYEADAAYVAAAFVESIRRGLAACGVPREGSRGRDLGERLCAILYRVAGLTGLSRMPRDLDAHERFRDAYDRCLRAAPPSARRRKMAAEIVGRILPMTAARVGLPVADHVARHLDAETARTLLPDGIDPGLDIARIEWRRRLRRHRAAGAARERWASRQALLARPDVAALRAAYERASPCGGTDRLVGAILLAALDGASGAREAFDLRSIDLEAGETWIVRGQAIEGTLLVLDAAAPLEVLSGGECGDAVRERRVIGPPTLLGAPAGRDEAPAPVTIVAPSANRLEVLVIPAARRAEMCRDPRLLAALEAWSQDHCLPGPPRPRAASRA